MLWFGLKEKIDNLVLRTNLHEDHIMMLTKDKNKLKDEIKKLEINLKLLKNQTEGYRNARPNRQPPSKVVSD